MTTLLEAARAVANDLDNWRPTEQVMRDCVLMGPRVVAPIFREFANRLRAAFAEQAPAVVTAEEVFRLMHPLGARWQPTAAEASEYIAALVAERTAAAVEAARREEREKHAGTCERYAERWEEWRHPEKAEAARHLASRIRFTDADAERVEAEHRAPVGEGDMRHAEEAAARIEVTDTPARRIDPRAVGVALGAGEPVVTTEGRLALLADLLDRTACLLSGAASALHERAIRQIVSKDRLDGWRPEVDVSLGLIEQVADALGRLEGVHGGADYGSAGIRAGIVEVEELRRRALLATAEPDGERS